MEEVVLILQHPCLTRGSFAEVAIRTLGIEVTQVVQDTQNSVPLIGGKTTIVLTYLDARLF